MPIARYQIRNKYCLADPELYRAADKDDPEALLEGVAMAGLVGVLRQLGDLAEFAAEIFHDLHEEVMVTAARGHDLMARVQQLEAEVPSLEKAFLSQTHHSSFISNGGINWHPNLRSEQNLISREDLPRFIMDSYEECRGPPRLFLLDKFDVAGAGGCLKRYTDPSFFKMESASSGLATVEVHRENRIRKIKKKGARLRNGETPEVVPTHTKLHQLLLEERIDNAFSDPSRLVKLKKRQSNGSAVETKSGKSYMEKFLDTPSPDHKVICETSIYPQHARLMSDETSETGIKILEISTISPVKRSLGNESTCSWPSEQEPELKPSSQMHWKTDEDLVKVHEQESAGVTDEMSSIHPKVTDETELAVDEQNKRKGSLDRYHSDDVTSEVDNYLDALATMESEMEADNGCRRQNNFLNIQKLTDSDDKEYQLRARFSDSQSFGDSSISDEISSLKLDRNEEHASDSQSIGTSSISDEIISFKRDRNEEMEQQALFSDSQYFGNSTLDLNSFFKKDRSCFSHSDSLSTVVENVQSKPILFPSTKYYESDIEDTPSNHLPQIVELQNTDCGEFVMHDDAHDKEEDISDSVQASSVSCLMNSGHILLHSDLGVASPMSLPTGTQSDETPSDPIELHLRLADDEDSECHVESIARITDALSLMNFDACPEVSSEKYPLNNLDDGDQYVSYDALSQISNDLEKAPEDECSDHSEIKVLLAESSNENCSEILVSREIGSQEHPICSSMEGLDLSSGTILPLDGLASEAVDGTIATQLNSEDLSPVHVSSFTGEHGSDLIHYSPQDEPDSVGVEVKCFDQQSNFEEISRMVHGDEISGSTCSVDADEDYIGKHNHVMVNDMVTAKVQSDDQAVYDVPSADSAENDVSINTCPASGITSSASRNLSNLQEPLLVSSYSHEMKKEPNEVESTEISVDLNAEKRENQLEPSSDITFSNIISSPIRNLRNLEESLFNFIDPHEKETEINKAVARESLTESEVQKVVDRPDFASPDVQLTLNRSFPCVPSNSEICNIQDSSLMEKTQYSSSVNDKKIVPKFSELETQESESISLWHNELLQNGKDGSLFPSYNQLESGTHLEQFLQVGQQDARLLLRDVENSSSEKLQSEQIQISNHLKEKRSFHGASESAPEIYLDQPESSESLSQSAGQEINPTKHVVDWERLLLPDHFPKASEINLEEIPPMPPLPPMQWRTGKVQHISLASFQPIKMIKINESTQYSLPTSERGTLQYQNPFLPIMAVESDKLQHTSGFSVGGHSVSIPFQLPIMINEAKSQYNYLLWERSQIQNPFLTLPVPVVSTSRPQHGYMVASEGEVAQYPNPSPPMPPDEHDSAGHDPISTQELSQPPSRLMTEPSLEVKTLQQSSSNLEGEQGDPSISPTLPPNMETVQPNHSLLPSEGEMVLSLDTSALTSDFEFEKPKNKLPRPRNPLIDAVAALDKSKLRKVSERVRPQIAPKVDERDSLLEQIRTKSFNLKPAAPTRPIIQGPKTNLKVAAILEKANAIRQALAGSDEDDDVDNWSDS